MQAMPNRITRLLAALIMIAIVAASPASAKRVALVIANSQYENAS